MGISDDSVSLPHYEYSPTCKFGQYTVRQPAGWLTPPVRVILHARGNLPGLLVIGGGRELGLIHFDFQLNQSPIMNQGLSASVCFRRDGVDSQEPRNGASGGLARRDAGRWTIGNPSIVRIVEVRIR